MATKGRGERDVADLLHRLLDIEESWKMYATDWKISKNDSSKAALQAMREIERQQVRYQARINWRHFKEQLLSYL